MAWGHANTGSDFATVSNELAGNVTELFSTRYAFAALKADGRVVAWGFNIAGGSSPLRVTGPLENALSWGVACVFTNDVAFLGLKTNGRLVSFGGHDSGGSRAAVSGALETASSLR